MDVIAIPHTGTNYTGRLLRNHMGVECREVNLFDRVDRPRGVVPIRDPMLSVISHLNRGERPNMDLWVMLAEWYGV